MGKEVLGPILVAGGTLKILPLNWIMVGTPEASHHPKLGSSSVWMSPLCLSGRFRVTLSSRQIRS